MAKYIVSRACRSGTACTAGAGTSPFCDGSGSPVNILHVSVFVKWSSESETRLDVAGFPVTTSAAINSPSTSSDAAAISSHFVQHKHAKLISIVSIRLSNFAGIAAEMEPGLNLWPVTRHGHWVSVLWIERLFWRRNAMLSAKSLWSMQHTYWSRKFPN